MNSFTRLLLIIVISFIPFVIIFMIPLAPHTHDSPVHYARIAAYYKALSEGQILPRWAGELNYGYGMPLFNFIYPVPYLISSIPVALGSGLVLSFKITLAISFILSGIFMYLFTMKFLNNEKRAMVATILYQFAPFHLIDLVVRGDFAEGYALAFLPLVLYAITTSFDEKNSKKNILSIGLSSLLLITSHNGISLIFFGIITLFVLVFSPNNHKRIEAILGLTLGVILSAFYWAPAIIERKYTYGDLFMKDMYKSHFAPLAHFFLPNFTNASHLQTGGIAVGFGLMHVIGLGTALFAITKKRFRVVEDKKIVWFTLGLTIIALCIMQPISRILWENIPILRMFQFPWRFLNITTFTLSLLGAVVLVSQKSSLFRVTVICIITILSSLVYFKPPLGLDQINEKYFWDYPLNSTFFGESDVIWSAGPAGSYPVNRFEVIGGDGIIKNPIKKGTVHTFTVKAESPVHVVDKTQYFPGWRVFSDNQKIPIEFQDQNWRGLITFRLPAGTHNVRVEWGPSKTRQIASGVSIFGFCITMGLILFINQKKRLS